MCRAGSGFRRQRRHPCDDRPKDQQRRIDPAEPAQQNPRSQIRKNSLRPTSQHRRQQGKNTGKEDKANSPENRFPDHPAVGNSPQKAEDSPGKQETSRNQQESCSDQISQQRQHPAGGSHHRSPFSGSGRKRKFQRAVPGRCFPEWSSRRNGIHSVFPAPREAAAPAPGPKIPESGSSEPR